MADQHLWEASHPYYATPGNYYKTGCHDSFGSWAEFVEGGAYDSDEDMNLLYRWDWRPSDNHLLLYFMSQRKAAAWSQEVAVTPDDEDAVRDWLTRRALTIAAIWSPLIGTVE